MVHHAKTTRRSTVHNLLDGLGIAWIIAFHDLKLALRRRETLVWTFLMPPLFFGFIGTVTGGSGSSGATQERPRQLVVEGAVDDAVAQRLIKRLEDVGFNVETRTGEPAPDPEARPPRLLLRIDAPAPGAVRAVRLESRMRGLDADYQTFRVRKATYLTLADMAAIEAAAAAPESGAEQDLTRLDAREQDFDALDTVPRTLQLDVQPAGERTEIPSGYQQAVPGNLVMFTLMVLLTTGAVSLVQERHQGLLRRLAVAPTARGYVVAGKWLARIALGALQIAFAALAGSLLFDMDWGGQPWMVALLLAAWASFCASAAMLLGNLGRTEPQVIGIAVASTMVLAALGGCWWPIEVAPEWMQHTQLVIPSGWTMHGLHRLISFGDSAADVLPHVSALLLASAILGGLAARYFRFE